jgi:hypothetical protein
MDDALHNITVKRLSFPERAIEINHVKHPRPVSFKGFRDGDRIAVISCRRLFAPLRKAHAFALAQINRRNYQHPSLPLFSSAPNQLIAHIRESDAALDQQHD